MPTEMKCEQYACSHHTVLGCEHPKCWYYNGLHNEVNALVDFARNKSELNEKLSVDT